MITQPLKPGTRVRVWINDFAASHWESGTVVIAGADDGQPHTNEEEMILQERTGLIGVSLDSDEIKHGKEWCATREWAEVEVLTPEAAFNRAAAGIR